MRCRFLAVRIPRTSRLDLSCLDRPVKRRTARGPARLRLASQVARIIRGKHKASYTPHVDCGDRVIVINADKIRLTGKKWDDKQYVRHSGYPGGQRFATPKMLKAKSATLIVESAVRGMLPKNRLGRKLFKNLYVYNDGEHPHEAQNPKEIKF